VFSSFDTRDFELKVFMNGCFDRLINYSKLVSNFTCGNISLGYDTWPDNLVSNFICSHIPFGQCLHQCK